MEFFFLNSLSVVSQESNACHYSVIDTIDMGILLAAIEFYLKQHLRCPPQTPNEKSGG